MASKNYRSFMMIVFLVFASLKFRAAVVINVLENGATGDGKTDDSQAFLSAWRAVCDGNDDATLLVPAERTYMLTPMEFQGPCKPSSITVQIDGNIATSWNVNKWLKNSATDDWLTFRKIKSLSIKGSGSIDGRGAVWWPIADKVQRRPRAFGLHGCDNIVLSGLTYLNSPSSHVSISDCNNLTFSDLQIFAPGDSPNTDGIDIARSTNVLIYNCTIGAGDDCVAINGGSSNINISYMACGPGHGIRFFLAWNFTISCHNSFKTNDVGFFVFVSIGSLGGHGEQDTVEQIHVQHCSLTNTTNGARIKTWQGGSGYARDITFEDIRLDSVRNPIIIDQYYCIDPNGCTNQTSAVKVSHVTYRDIRGTSKNEDALILKCSESVACTNLLFDIINITSIGSQENTLASCTNAHGQSHVSFPSIDCLLP